MHYDGPIKVGDLVYETLDGGMIKGRVTHISKRGIRVLMDCRPLKFKRLRFKHVDFKYLESLTLVERR